ncbi:alpha/beta fold hydrolase [Candidatus Sumerlaeota bacterium]|nr:alpha/beta fold hydrolase [Candidatus Sumerlaeota bacterium]
MTRAWRSRILKAVGIAAALLFLCLLLHSCVVQQVLRTEIASTPRDPITGVALGTEAVTLVPPAGSDAATSRTACLLVHGFLAARTDFADLGERLCRRGFTVRMLRLPGHGTTPVDFAYQPDGALFRAVQEEFRALHRDFDRVDVVGFSMGGALSTLLASREPVDRLVLVAPFYRVTYKWYYVLRPETWNTLLGRLAPYMIRPTAFVKLNDRSNFGKFFFYGIVPSRGTRQLVRLGREARLPETLERVACPVLLVHSEGDEASSPKAARAALARMASSVKRTLWLERSNHVLFWDFDREEVKTRIEKFLTARDPSTEREASL